MATASSEAIRSLQSAGFTRPTMASVSRYSVKQISDAKCGHIEFMGRTLEKLQGLRRWFEALHDNPDFTLNPVPYYEAQMILLDMDGEQQFTTIHDLYEAELISSDEMTHLALRFSSLYDYNAFIEEHPEQATLEETNDGELNLIAHFGVPEVSYDSLDNRNKIRYAVEALLES